MQLIDCPNFNRFKMKKKKKNKEKKKIAQLNPKLLLYIAFVATIMETIANTDRF